MNSPESTSLPSTEVYQLLADRAEAILQDRRLRVQAGDPAPEGEIRRAVCLGAIAGILRSVGLDTPNDFDLDVWKTYFRSRAPGLPLKPGDIVCFELPDACGLSFGIVTLGHRHPDIITWTSYGHPYEIKALPSRAIIWGGPHDLGQFDLL